MATTIQGQKVTEAQETLATRPNGEEIRFSYSEYKGKAYLGIRSYYKAPDGSMQPGKNGINLPIEEAKALIEGGRKVEQFLREVVLGGGKDYR